MKIYKKCIDYTSISTHVHVRHMGEFANDEATRTSHVYAPGVSKQGVTEGGLLITGPLGEIRMHVTHYAQSVFATHHGNTLVLFMIAPAKGKKGEFRPILNTIARHVYNCIIGVTSGYLSELQIVGLGYRVSTAANGDLLAFTLGETRDIYVPTRSDQVYYINSSQTSSVMTYGINKHKVYQTEAKMKRLSSVDKYKGKGIRVAGETPLLKAGKRK